MSSIALDLAVYAKSYSSSTSRKAFARHTHTHNSHAKMPAIKDIPERYDDFVH